jgi:hypothetical protein
MVMTGIRGPSAKGMAALWSTAAMPFSIGGSSRIIVASKQRYDPMLGFGVFPSAQRFCRAFEEVRQYFRPRRQRKPFVSLAQGRRPFLARAQALEAMFRAA